MGHTIIRRRFLLLCDEAAWVKSGKALAVAAWDTPDTTRRWLV
jgi:hypothetical protein